MSASLTPRSRVLAAAAAGSLLLSAGCGLKQSASDALKQNGGVAGAGAVGGAAAGGTVGGGAAAGGAGGTGPTAGGLTTAGGSFAGGSASGGTTSGGGSATTGGSSGGTSAGTTSGSGASTTAGGASRVGIDDKAKTINLILHAPITGAAPIPATAFEKGANLFWGQAGHDVFGYKVHVDVVDDQYRADVARHVCEAGAANHFIVIGAAGTDQIQACGSDPVLTRSSTPYFSAGVTTNGLTSSPNYFAASLTYKDQIRGVIQNTRDHGGDFSNCAIVTTNTPNFDDVTAAAKAGFGKICGKLSVIRPEKNNDQQYAQQIDGQLRQTGAKTVFVDLAPTFWLYMLSDAGPNGYNPLWVGPGVTMGENEVVALACRAEPLGLKAAFLSPYPGLDRAPAGFKSSGYDNDNTKADIEMSLYGLSEVMWKVMLSVGSAQNLTRQNLIAKMPTFSATGLSIYPDVKFGGTHFGGTAAWSLVPDCNNSVWKTGHATVYPK